MNNPSELDLAGLKHDMRVMYQHLGFEESVQVLYEMMMAANILSEVIVEERTKNDEKGAI
jgi:uncharacterized membrane-anchored protein YhcB (DUF1043 family)